MVLQRWAIMISIHAPERGATVSSVIIYSHDFISIHAPERGATGVGVWCKRGNRFQSTLPNGERPITISLLVAWYSFQSTLPNGERPGCNKFRHNIFNFNPRSRTGSDDIGIPCVLQPCYFNPRSRTGSDDGYLEFEGKCKYISIHAPERGATLWRGPAEYHAGISIHAPERGATGAI